MGMSMLSYDIEDQTGFPFDHLYGGVVEDAMDGLDCVLPITLESNVIKLHEFLYPEDSYVPSDEVKSVDLEKNPDWIIRRMVHWQLIMNQIQSLRIRQRTLQIRRKKARQM